MGSSISIEISDELRSALDEAAVADGVSASEIVNRALRRHLFVRRLRALRAETLDYVRKVGLGDLSDGDVFRMVS